MKKEKNVRLLSRFDFRQATASCLFDCLTSREGRPTRESVIEGLVSLCYSCTLQEEADVHLSFMGCVRRESGIVVCF